MVPFKITLKTKNGNKIHKKETFTAFFSLKQKVNVLTNTTNLKYTYKIKYSDKNNDPKKVLQLKTEDIQIHKNVFALRVISNLCHVINGIIQKEKIKPDFILFISPDIPPPMIRMLSMIFDYHKESLEEIFSAGTYKRQAVTAGDFMLIKSFVDWFPDTKMMIIDPKRDPVKYKKSQAICDSLAERFQRQVIPQEELWS